MMDTLTSAVADNDRPVDGAAGDIDAIARIESALDRVDYVLAVTAAVEELGARGWKYDA
jgi:hypothetical protein